MTRLEEVNYAALTIERGWRWTRKRIVLGAACEERLQEKFSRAPATSRGVFASGSQRQGKDGEPQGHAIHPEAVEKDWRMIFDEELANLELDLAVRSRRVEW